MEPPGLEPPRAGATRAEASSLPPLCHHTLTSPSALELCFVSVPPLAAPKLHLTIALSPPPPWLVAPLKVASYPPSHSFPTILAPGLLILLWLPVPRGSFSSSSLGPGRGGDVSPPLVSRSGERGVQVPAHLRGSQVESCTGFKLIQRQNFFLSAQHRDAGSWGSPGLAVSTAPCSKRTCYLWE